jgi:nifR3 family TIM-barrel protein
MNTPVIPAFWVNQVPVYGRLVLSPMDGISDHPFRLLTRRLGSAMSYTEFINTLDVLQKFQRVAPRIFFSEEERPVVFQLLDDNPERLLQVALRLQAHQPDIIDVNLGCSSRTVCARGAGASLLRSPEKVAQMISLLARNLSIPVSAKIRLGWDDISLNYCEIAHIIEDNGGKLIAVHGRTRVQGYSGQANWDAIAEIKQAVNIPVIGNGDVRTVNDIQRMRDHTGCNAVMVGRIAIDNPWIFSGYDRSQVPVPVVIQTIQDHLDLLVGFYGDYGLIPMRKHLKRYLKHHRIRPEVITSLWEIQTKEELASEVARILMQ